MKWPFSFDPFETGKNPEVLGEEENVVALNCKNETVIFTENRGSP